jgi:hypothetical protein
VEEVNQPVSRDELPSNHFSFAIVDAIETLPTM